MVRLRMDGPASDGSASRPSRPVHIHGFRRHSGRIPAGTRFNRTSGQAGPAGQGGGGQEVRPEGGQAAGSKEGRQEIGEEVRQKGGQEGGQKLGQAQHAEVGPEGLLPQPEERQGGAASGQKSGKVKEERRAAPLTAGSGRSRGRPVQGRPFCISRLLQPGSDTYPLAE